MAAPLSVSDLVVDLYLPPCSEHKDYVQHSHMETGLTMPLLAESAHAALHILSSNSLPFSAKSRPSPTAA